MDRLYFPEMIWLWARIKEAEMAEETMTMSIDSNGHAVGSRATVLATTTTFACADNICER